MKDLWKAPRKNKKKAGSAKKTPVPPGQVLVSAAKYNTLRQAASRASLPRQSPARFMQARPTVDSTAKRFLNAVADPFRATPSRGITNTSFYSSTACIRRRSLCTISLTPGASGAEVFIPQGYSSDPWAIVATNATADWSGTNTLTAYNYDNTVTVPVSANGRIVASGVRITPLASVTNAGGVWYHYWQPHGADGGSGNSAPALALGAGRTSATEAISCAPVKPGETITFINPSGISWLPIGNTGPTGGLGSTLGVGTAAGAALPAGSHGTRLFFDGDGTQRFLIDIVSIIEYYHDTHRNFSEPSVTHRDGEHLTNAANSMLSQRSSNNTHVEQHGGHSRLSAKLHNLALSLEGAGKVAMTTMGAVYNGIKGARAIKNLINGTEALALMA